MKGNTRKDAEKKFKNMEGLPSIFKLFPTLNNSSLSLHYFAYYFRCIHYTKK